MKSEWGLGSRRGLDPSPHSLFTRSSFRFLELSESLEQAKVVAVVSQYSAPFEAVVPAQLYPLFFILLS